MKGAEGKVTHKEPGRAYNVRLLKGGSHSMEIMPLTGVCERDIDLLLIEELMASPNFLSWFLDRIGLQGAAGLIAIHHSVNAANGESDIEIDLEYQGGKAKVLVENKIDAPLQPRQSERYADRAAHYADDKKFKKVISVLTAPDDYAGGSSNSLGFHKRISYESILQWFSNATELGSRRDYKMSLLTSAIERGSSGWTLVPDERATTFWTEYWLLAERYAKDLRMPKPSKKPATSSFIFFQPIGLDPTVKLIHKVPYGKVDLQFAGMGDCLEELERKYKESLTQEMIVVKASKSGAIRIKVPELNLQGRFSETKARKGLEAAQLLLKLYKENRKR
jgi:hypothetical protein